MRWVDRLFLPLSLVFFLCSAGFAVHRVVSVRRGVAATSLVGPSAELRVTGIRPVPERKNYPGAAQWLSAVEDHSLKVETALADQCSNTEKIRRSAELIDAVAGARPTLTPLQQKRARAVLQRQQTILGTLSDPEQAIRDAWSAFDLGDVSRAMRIGEMLAKNPNYDCPDVEVALGYWSALDGDYAAAVNRLGKVAQNEGYPGQDLAAYLIPWVELQRGELKEATKGLRELLDEFPESTMREPASSLLGRLVPLVEPQGTDGTRR